MNRLVTLLVFLALLASACSSTVSVEAGEDGDSSPDAENDGSSSNNTDDDDDDDDAEPTPTTEPTPDPVADAELARELLLDDSILGPGWTAEPDDDEEDDDDEGLEELAGSAPECSALVEFGALNDGGIEFLQARIRESSPTYVFENDEVDFSASVYETVGEAENSFEIVRSLNIGPCFGVLFAQQFEEGVVAGLAIEVGEPVISEPTVQGDDGFGLEVAIPIALDSSDESLELTLRFALYASRRGRAVVSSTVLALSDAVPDDKIIAALYDRLIEVVG